MTITYPLSLPSAPDFNGVTVRKMHAVGLTRSPYTAAQQAVAYAGQWWEMDLALPPLKDDSLAVWEAFFGQLHGQLGTFLLGDPARKTARGACASTPGTPLVDGAVAAMAQALPIKGAPALVQGWLLAGDYIQLGSGSTARLYQALADADTDSAGETVVDVWPRIRSGLAGNEAIVVANAKGVFRLENNGVDCAKRPGVFGTVQFTAIEAL